MQQLRSATATLDNEILTTLQSLASTRRELKATPETQFPLASDTYSFTYRELLSYARRISRLTIPPVGSTLVEMGLDTEGNPILPAPPEGVEGNGGATSTQPQQLQPTNGATGTSNTQENVAATVVATETDTPSASAPTPADGGASQPSPIPAPNAAPGHGTPSFMHSTALPPEHAKIANPYLDTLFLPFPNQGLIVAGALVANQLLAESGIDPRGYDPVAEQTRKEEEERERLETAEKERLHREEENMRIRREREEQMLRRQREKEERKQKEEEERQKEEKEKKKESESINVEKEEERGAQGQTRTGAVGLPVRSPAVEKKSKGEFQFIDDLDDED